jgi:CheY-like chemotaxis protein
MSHIHALVIEDDSNSVQVISMLLKQQGLSCTAFKNPQDVVDALGSIEPFDVVFLDLEMPNVDGYQMFEFLRKNGVNQPIIACTVHTNEMETARELGFNGFVSKPLDPLRFTDQISSILSGQPVWDGD